VYSWSRDQRTFVEPVLPAMSSNTPNPTAKRTVRRMITSSRLKWYTIPWSEQVLIYWNGTSYIPWWPWSEQVLIIFKSIKQITFHISYCGPIYFMFYHHHKALQYFRCYIRQRIESIKDSTLVTWYTFMLRDWIHVSDNYRTSYDLLLLLLLY